MAVTQTNARKTSAKAKPTPGAIQVLKADHREVENWFDEFKDTTNGPRKLKLAKQICLALKVHTQIEEEIFYPACRDAGVDMSLLDEADVEHDAAKKLIKEIEAGKPGDDHWDAKVTVLGEMIKHHVKEEEQVGGMFHKAKRAGLDMEELGEKLQARKDALMKRAKARQ